MLGAGPSAIWQSACPLSLVNMDCRAKGGQTGLRCSYVVGTSWCYHRVLVSRCRVSIIARPGVQIKKMTDRDIARLWSQYVKELAVLLVRAEGGDPPPEVIARMEELVCRELLLLYIR